MNIKPYGHNILVRPAQETQVIATREQSLFSHGEVVKVGDQVKDFKEGDYIGFLKWGTRELEIDGETYTFLPETDEFILTKIEK